MAETLRRDNHSSRPAVASRLKLPTRRLSEPLHRLLTWDCSGWRLPRFTLRPDRSLGEDSSLWPYSARHRGWSLAITLLYGVRTFLPFRSHEAAEAAVVWSASRGASLALFRYEAPTAWPKDRRIQIEAGVDIGIAPARNPHDGQRAEMAGREIGVQQRLGQRCVE